jgi:septal ring-binding cell division protein DamX/type II secretory pathway predicted ATPase ExeA
MTKTAANYDAENYVQRLDLGDDPFAADFHVDYFYTGAMRRQLLDQLIHFSRFSDQTVVLVGASGSGTSTLLDQASALIEDVMDSCFINGEELVSPEQLLSSLNEQLNLQLPTPIKPSEFIAALQATSIVDGEPEWLLIEVDQAHYLSLESFELLRDLAALNHIVRLLIVGEYQVEPLLRLAAFDQEQIKLLELDPLTVSETGDYLLGLLQSVGYAGELPFNSDQLCVLHQQSGGNVTEINQLTPALLTAKSSQSPSQFKMGIPLGHLAAITIIGIALLLSWWYQGNDIGDSRQQITINTPQNIATTGAPSLELLAEQRQGGIVRTESSQVKTDLVEPQIKAHNGSKSSQLSISGEKRIQVDESESVLGVNTTPGSEASSTKLVVNDAESKMPNSPVKPGLIAPIKSEALLKTEQGSIKPSVLAKSADLNMALIEQKNERSTGAVSESAVLPVVVNSVSAKPKVKAIPAREQRLLKYAASDYVLQLMGSVDEARTRSFVKQYVGRLPVSYFETRRKEKPWFVAITGPYDNRAAALSGVKVLPTALQKQRPWARSIAGIQKDIRANRQ